MFEYTDYKAFLKEKLPRGTQKQLAAFMGCQPAFLSQVLRGKPHLSLEHGLLAAEYFQLASSEKEYFMLALQFGRAGSSQLSAYFQSKMQALRERYRRVDSRIGDFEKLDEIARATYYSSWKFATTLVLLSIATENQLQLIRAKTGLSTHEIERTLDFMKSTGLIERRAGRWRPSKKRIHIAPEDPLIG